MRELSIFDIIGPNMIGPSSSHTAGALRISLMAGKLSPGTPKHVKFILYGSFAKTYKGHGTDRALVGGILGYNTEDARIKDSFAYAEKEGITFEFEPFEQPNNYHPNTVEVIITNTDDVVTSVLGVSVGGGVAKLKQINGVDISMSGMLHTLFIQQKDAPGVIAHISKCLNDDNINIAFMKVYRKEKGTNAYTIIEADETIPQSVLNRITAYPNIYSAMILEL